MSPKAPISVIFRPSLRPQKGYFVRSSAIGARRLIKIALLGATALTFSAAAAFANNGDPAYLQYDGGAVIGSDNSPIGSVGPAGPVSGPIGSVGLSFEGVSQYDVAAFGRNFVPPDTMGAVGATQFMETTNGGYAVFDKATGARQSIMSDVAFWAAAGRTGAFGDSRVMFDKPSQRWIVESFAASLDTIQVAVSDGSNALGGWHSTSFTGFAGGIADYPTLAMDSKAVYIATNDFTAGGSYAGETLNVINRNDLFGAPGTANVSSLKQFFTPLSAVLGGADPGYAIQGVNNGNGNIISVSIQTSDIIQFNVNNPGSAGATLTAPTYLGTTPYGVNKPGAQPGDAVIKGPVIDTLDDRISGSAWQQNGKIYAVHTVTPLGGSHSELVWTVSDAATGHLIQQGTISGGGYDYYQGSLAVNASGQVVISYDRSGSTPGGGLISIFAKSFGSNALGQLYGTGTYFLHTSNTDQYHNGSLDGQAARGRQRWGDYSAVTVDPNNDQSFWVIGEFAREFNDAANGHPGGSGGSRWGTWISDLHIAAIPEPATWTGMLLGFGLIGGALRRRSSTTLA